jgi:hypothetical protein
VHGVGWVLLNNIYAKLLKPGCGNWHKRSDTFQVCDAFGCLAQISSGVFVARAGVVHSGTKSAVLEQCNTFITTILYRDQATQSGVELSLKQQCHIKIKAVVFGLEESGVVRGSTLMPYIILHPAMCKTLPCIHT